MNRLGVARECDRQTDRQTDRSAFSNSAVKQRALKTKVMKKDIRNNRNVYCFLLPQHRDSGKLPRRSFPVKTAGYRHWFSDVRQGSRQNDHELVTRPRSPCIRQISDAAKWISLKALTNSISPPWPFIQYRWSWIMALILYVTIVSVQWKAILKLSKRFDDSKTWFKIVYSKRLEIASTFSVFHYKHAFYDVDIAFITTRKRECIATWGSRSHVSPFPP